MNGTISAFPTLDPRALFSRPDREDPLLSRSSLRLYASARSAIYHAARSQVTSPNSTFLVPAYHCGVEVEAIRRAGYRPVIYRIGEDSQIDLNDIRARISPSTRGILVTHFFGFPQDLTGIVSLCKDRGLILLEDCAHSLYSRFPDGTWLGTLGDFGAFSLYKTAFLPNGGALLVNRSGLQLPPAGRAHFDFALLKTTIRSMMDHEAAGTAFSARPTRFVLSFGRATRADSTSNGPSSEKGAVPWYYTVPRFAYENGISFLSRMFLSRTHAADIVANRRRNYLLLAEMLREARGVQMQFPALPEGACPLAMPLLVDHRDAVERAMRAEGIETYVFGRSFHPLFAELALPEARRLSQRGIALPIHHQLGPGDIRRVADSLLAASAREQER